MRHLTRIALPLLAALAAGALVSACGGEDEQEAQEVIDRAFSTAIESADASLGLDVELEGSDELEEPIRAQVSGPFRSGGSERIPSFDFDLALQGAGAEVPPLGLVSTGDNVFVEVQGVAYELGEEVVAQQNEQLARQSDDAPGLGALGVDPREWIVDAAVEDDDVDVAGVATTHVSASIDVPALIDDLNDAAQQAGGVGAGPAPTLSEDEQALLEEAVEDPAFDVFVGNDDDKVRRVTATLGFEIPEEGREDVGGIAGGTLSFSLELANVDGDQEITAPEDARPLAELAEQIGALGGLLGGPGGGLPVPEGGSGGAPTAPENGSGGALPAPEGGADGGAAPDPGGSPSADAFQQYGECLEQADPSDQEALQACNELIEP